MRNTICATLTAIIMFLLTPVFLIALAGCGSASKTSTPAHAIAATGTTCSKRSGRHQGMHRHAVRHEASGLRRLRGLPEGRPVMRLEPCERRGQGAGKMSYNVVTQEGVRTFENIDDAGDYAQAMSLRTGEPAKVFHAETGLVAFTVRPTTKDTK